MGYTQISVALLALGFGVWRKAHGLDVDFSYVGIGAGIALSGMVHVLQGRD